MPQNHLKSFVKHLEEKKYSLETIDSYKKTLNLFYGYISFKYQKDKEVFQISSSDIKSFLKVRLEEGISSSTVNKDLAILKTYFNYLWEIDKVPVDPAVKIKRKRVEEHKTTHLKYSDLLMILPKILNNREYTPLRKVIFILGLKGIKTSELSLLKKEDISIVNDQVYIDLSNRTLVLSNIEAEYFLEYYHSTLFLSNEYVFTSKRQKNRKRKEDKSVNNEEIVPIEAMSILSHLYRISDDYQLNDRLTLTSMRTVYTYHLYTEEHLSIEQISEILGIEKVSVIGSLKSAVDKQKIRKTS